MVANRRGEAPQSTHALAWCRLPGGWGSRRGEAPWYASEAS